MSRKLTTKEFVAKARETHSDLYNYSNSEYTNNNTKITIGCEKHGDFEQRPGDHLQGRGCSKCAGRELTKEDFVIKAKEVHGDLYNYSKSKYINNKTKLTIICEKHGDFEQIPGYHLQGNGCSKCGGNEKLTKEEFIIKAKEIHGNLYDYSKSQYINNKTKLTIICEKHGDFAQKPNSHLQGSGCAKCSGYGQTIEEFVIKAKEVHGDLYDYSKSKFAGNNTKITIICPTHGCFEQIPKSHLLGSGCAKCAGCAKLTTEEFVIKAKEVHGDLYDYSKSKYVKSNTKLTIICPTHGCFEQAPNSHMGGRGCLKCAGSGFDWLPYEEAKAYVQSLSIQNGDDYYRWSKAGKRPENIPVNAQRFYTKQGTWISWSDWLGVTNRWNKQAWISFLKALAPYISTMNAAELMALARQKNVPKSLIRTTVSEDSLVSRLRDLCDLDKTEQDKIAGVQDLITELENNDSELEELPDDIDDIEEFINTDDDIIDEDEITTKATPPKEHTLSPTNFLTSEDIKSTKGLIENFFDDPQTIKFIVNNRVNRLWYELFRTNDFDAIDKKLKEGDYELITDMFMEEYNGAKSIAVPDGFSYTNGRERVEPNNMQLLTAWKLQQNKRMGNWSGVGAGKTLSAIFSGRHLKCKTTVVIVNNNTIDGWKDAIMTFFPDSHVVEQNNMASLSLNGYRYIIINYEKFQMAKSKTLVDNLLAKNPDFIVVDELQSVKNREVLQESRRRIAVHNFIKNATDNNPELYVLGMSATPCVNNLQEIRGLLEIITGDDLSHIPTRHTWNNASAFHELLVCHGLRYLPKYDSGVKLSFPTIDGKPWLKELLRVDRGNVSDQEQLLCKIKLDEIVSRLQPGTIIYTEYVTGIVPMLKKACEEAGFKTRCFTGGETELEKKQNKQRFIDGIDDVLIGSSAVGTGVDGLQTVCSQLIFACLPWTNSEFEQIIGRVYRQGRKFDHIPVVIPQVEVLLGSGEDGKPLKWSRDAERMNIIIKKRTLMDCAIDGVQPTQGVVTEKMAKEGLEAMIERISNGDGTLTINTPTTVKPLTDKEIADKRVKEFTVMNRTWSTMKSESLHNLLTKEPGRWRRYHTLLSEARKNWAEVPFEVIGKQIKRSDWLIADLGCGEALFAHTVSNTVHSYDHVAINDFVTACDISNIPVDDNTYDAVVMSLVCMGANWRDYFKEASRILKPYGMLFVAEPLKNIHTDSQEERMKKIEDAITNQGFNIVSKDLSGEFVYFKAVNG